MPLNKVGDWTVLTPLPSPWSTIGPNGREPEESNVSKKRLTLGGMGGGSRGRVGGSSVSHVIIDHLNTDSSDGLRRLYSRVSFDHQTDHEDRWRRTKTLVETR